MSVGLTDAGWFARLSWISELVSDTRRGRPRHVVDSPLLEIVREGQPSGVLVIVWRRVDGEWRIVAYRTIE